MDIVCYYFWEDGICLNVYVDFIVFGKEVEDKFGVLVDWVYIVLFDSVYKYEFIGCIFFEKLFYWLFIWINVKVFKVMLKIFGLDLFISMNWVNECLL